MGTSITAGARVRVKPRNELVRQHCPTVHYLAGVPLEGALGTVDRVDEPAQPRDRAVPPYQDRADGGIAGHGILCLADWGAHSRGYLSLS
jgi:hypothetical protein